MDIINEPVITAGGAATGLVNTELSVGVKGSVWQRGLVLSDRTARGRTEVGFERHPPTRRRAVLKLQIFP